MSRQAKLNSRTKSYDDLWAFNLGRMATGYTNIAQAVKMQFHMTEDVLSLRTPNLTKKPAMMIIFRSSHRKCFVRKGTVRNFSKFTEKHLYQSLFFIKVADVRPPTLLTKILWHKSFPVNFEKFLRTPFLQNTSGRLCLHLFSNSFMVALLPKEQLVDVNPQNVKFCCKISFAVMMILPKTGFTIKQKNHSFPSQNYMTLSFVFVVHATGQSYIHCTKSEVFQ